MILLVIEHSSHYFDSNILSVRSTNIVIEFRVVSCFISRWTVFTFDQLL